MMPGRKVQLVGMEAPDADAAVDLREVFDRAFDQGGYAESIDHGEPPSVELSELDLDWATERAHAT